MTLENGIATLAARTVSNGEPLEVSLSFSDEITVGRVKFPDRFAQSIESDVEESVDRAFVEAEQAVAALEDAASDYEFEASLRGLRVLIPDIVNPVISQLNALPGAVASSAYTTALSVMASKCTVVIVKKVCVDDVVDEKAYARDARDRARCSRSSPDRQHTGGDLPARLRRARSARSRRRRRTSTRRP